MTDIKRANKITKGSHSPVFTKSNSSLISLGHVQHSTTISSLCSHHHVINTFVHVLHALLQSVTVYTTNNCMHFATTGKFINFFHKISSSHPQPCSTHTSDCIHSHLRLLQNWLSAIFCVGNTTNFLTIEILHTVPMI